MSSLSDRDLEVLWHPCSQMRDYEQFEPLEIYKAKGSCLYTADGAKILDAISSWWCKSLGHCHPHLQAALIAQAENFDQVILANSTNPAVVRLCERLLNMANGHSSVSWDQRSSGLEAGFYQKVFLTDSGSAAVEVAMKMAIHAQQQRGQQQRKKFTAFKNGYHGETIATLSVGDCGLYGEPYRDLLFPVSMIDGLPYRSGPHDKRWMDCSAEWPAIEAQLNKQQDELAAIVYEPVLQGAGGMRVYSPELLCRLRAWATAHNVYLIADEIAAGMGRCGSMLASHLAKNKEGIALADFAVLSKGLTGGVLPLSAVLTTNAVYDIFLADYTELKAFMHSSTYTGNALAVAVANATLDVFADKKICVHVERMHGLMMKAFSSLVDQRNDLCNLRAVGLMAAVDICQPDGQPFDWKLRIGYAVFRQALALGAWLRPLGDTMYIFPPLNASDHELLEIIDILRKSLKVVMDKNRDTLFT